MYILYCSLDYNVKKRLHNHYRLKAHPRRPQVTVANLARRLGQVRSLPKRLLPSLLLPSLLLPSLLLPKILLLRLLPRLLPQVLLHLHLVQCLERSFEAPQKSRTSTCCCRTAQCISQQRKKSMLTGLSPAEKGALSLQTD